MLTDYCGQQWSLTSTCSWPTMATLTITSSWSTVVIDGHAFGANNYYSHRQARFRGDLYSSNDLQQYHQHVQVVAVQTSPIKGTIHHTADNEKYLTRMILTALLRHLTMKFCLISEQKRRRDFASPRMKGESLWTGKALTNASARKRSGSVRNTLLSRAVSRSSETAAALPPASTQGSETKQS